MSLGFYHPDWVAVQETQTGEVNWIIETKGRVWEGTAAKDDAIREWCERITEATGSKWHYIRIDQTFFDTQPASTLGDLTRGPSQRTLRWGRGGQTKG
jgi:type III restriction enzyme